MVGTSEHVLSSWRTQRMSHSAMSNLRNKLSTPQRGKLFSMYFGVIIFNAGLSPLLHLQTSGLRNSS